MTRKFQMQSTKVQIRTGGVKPQNAITKLQKTNA